MGRWQLHDVLEESIGRGNIAIDQILIKSDRVDFLWNASFEDGFDLGAKDQPLSIPVIIQRLLAKAVTGREKAPTLPVPNGEREHTAQVLDTIITKLFIRMNNGLGIAIGVKVMPTLLKFFAKFKVVIDFSIVDDENALIFVKYGLVTTRHVNNRETAAAQCCPITYPDSLVVWPTMPDDLAHTIDKLFSPIQTKLCVYKSRYSAHKRASFL